MTRRLARGKETDSCKGTADVRKADVRIGGLLDALGYDFFMGRI